MPKGSGLNARGPSAVIIIRNLLYACEIAISLVFRLPQPSPTEPVNGAAEDSRCPCERHRLVVELGGFAVCSETTVVNRNAGDKQERRRIDDTQRVPAYWKNAFLSFRLRFHRPTIQAAPP